MLYRKYSVGLAHRTSTQYADRTAKRRVYEAAAVAQRGKPDTAALHDNAARSWTALGTRANAVREKLATAHDTRCEWEVMTAPTRRLARASDIELKRRGVLTRDDQFRSAEPEGFVYPHANRASTAASNCRATPGAHPGRA